MNILVWILVWYMGFAGYYLFFKKRNILYKNRPKLIMGWYALMSLVGFSLFHAQIMWVMMKSTTISETLGVCIVIISLIAWYKTLMKRDYVEHEASRNVFLSKTSEIIFQQVFVWALFGIIQGVVPSISPLVIFTLVFFIIHIPLFLVIPSKKALFFVVASLAGGIGFAICLTYIPSGYLLALAVHVGFYIAVASKKRIWGVDTFYVM